MPTLAQIRAARALLGWSQSDLADHAGLSQTGIARIENGTHQPNTATMAKIDAAFDRADIEFLGDTGLRQRTGEVKTYRGQDGFRDFMDDVYETCRDQGGEVCLFNTQPSLWHKYLGEDWYKMHSKRMAEISDKIKVRIAIQEGDDSFILPIAEYRWIPKDKWKDKMFYAYGPKLGLLSFKNDDIEILVINEAEFADSFRVLYEMAWENETIPINK